MNKPEKGSSEKGLINLEEMVEVTVKHLKPGTILVGTTYDVDGNLVHEAQTAFTEDQIQKLTSLEIDKIYYSKPKTSPTIIKQPKSGKKSLQEYIADNTYKGPRAIQIETQKKAISVMGKITEVIENETNGSQTFEEAREVISQVLNDIDESIDGIINLLDIQAYDDYTYTHCLNVGVIGMVFARKMNMPDDMVEEIGLGGFLHDIGKVKVPYELINKTTKLSAQEFDEIKHHAKIGYEIIKNNSNLSEPVKKMVLLHHEKYDGSGYPLGLKSDEIEEYVEVIAISDYYDALTTERSYKKAYPVKETLNLIIKFAGKFFKTDLAHRFAEEMNVVIKESNFYTVGCYVLLNTNEIAQVVSKDSEMTSRPGIKIITTSQGKTLNKPISVELNLDGTRHIVRIVDASSLDKNIVN